MFEVKDAEAPADERKNVVRKNVVVKQGGKVGDIAHYHKKESDTEIWDEPCYFVNHTVHDEKGFSINEKRYVGKVVVSQCMADQLAYQEALHAQYEQGIYRSNKLNRIVGSY